MGMVVKRFDIYLVNLDPTHGSEIKKTSPCLVISPDEMNIYINTVIVAPMTTKGRNYPTRIPVIFKDRTDKIVLDQIRTIDKSCLIMKLGTIRGSTQEKVLSTLNEMFSP